MLFDKKSERPNVHLNHISSGLGVLFGLDTTSGLAYYRQCAEPKAICRRLESQERWRQLDTQHRLTWLAARDSVVWALDASGFVLVREHVELLSNSKLNEHVSVSWSHPPPSCLNSLNPRAFVVLLLILFSTTLYESQKGSK